MRKLLGGLILILVGTVSFAQNFSNKGKDFWVGYGYHQIMHSSNGMGTNGQNMVLYFATDQITTVTVSIPGTGYSVTYPNIPANTVFTSNPIPKTGINDVRLQQESTAPENKGIHIVADKPIVAYAHIYNMSVSGATILFPTNTLGKEYYSINYTNISNSNNSNCWFYVIACDEGVTTVEITPSASTINHPAGVPFTVTLTQGQVYNFMGQLTGGGGGTFTGVDLTGSKIQSIASASGACKRIAVFSGSGRIGITCDGSAGTSDNYMVQAMPKSAWGKKFLTVPTGGLPNNIFRICVSDPTANVLVNGAPITHTLQNNFYYEVPASRVTLKIESDLPITVAQYITSNNSCNNIPNPTNTLGDPEVIYLSPVEQNISKVIWNATNNFAITTHYYSVIIPNTGTAISSFRLDGIPINPALFTIHPRDPAFSMLTQTVSPGQHIIQSDSGFNAIAYGYGSNESYGYNAGTNVRDLLQQVGVSSTYAIEEGPSICAGTAFKFKVSLPYMADSIRWGLNSLPGSPADILMTYSNPPDPGDADSTTVINGKTVYWYSLPSFYNFSAVGVYPVVITAYAATTEGCGNAQEISFELEVSNPPTPNIDWVYTGCTGQPVQFNDRTISAKPTYKWWWEFRDNATGTIVHTSTQQNPVYTFPGAGTYRVRFSNITTPGCVSDTISRQIVINPLPVGNIAGDVTVCQNQPAPNVVFTGTTGTAPFTFTYNINNGPAQTIVTTSGNSVSLPVPTGTVGNYNYHLVSIKDAAGTAGGCSQPMPDTVRVTVNPLASATIAGTATVCQNSSTAAITFTASGGSVQPFTFSYNINGGAVQTISTVSGNTVSLPVPTGATGTFVYNLLSVRDASVTACSQLQTGSATVTVRALPTATITGTSSVCATAAILPLVTFTGSGGTGPYTFTYTLNGGPQQTVSGTGNTATVAVPTTTAGTFVYNLISVREGSTTACAQPQTGTATVVVHPLPTANFNIPAALCQSRTINFTDNSTPNTGTINNWSWTFGDPSSGTANTSVLANPSHVFANTGNYSVTLTVRNSEGCFSTPVSRPVTINGLPTAAFTLPEVCLLDPIAQFTDNSTGSSTAAITGWQWNFGDPGSGVNNTSTQQNGQHSYSSVGTYPVRLVVTTSDGCTDTLPQPLIVNGGNPVADFVQMNALTSCSSDTVSIQNKSTIGSGSITKVEIHWDNT
ncbi:MAG: PKD domain-containing protein, partial [Sphingobacteriales bacterium]